MESTTRCNVTAVPQQGSVFDRPDVRLFLDPPEVPYQPMSKRELSDLEREARREFTPGSKRSGTSFASSSGSLWTTCSQRQA